MAQGQYLDVDPRTLLLPTQRLTGADPGKLQRQIAQHGTSDQGMLPLVVEQAKDGRLVILDGVTRATRIAKLCPGRLVRVYVSGNYRGWLRGLPTIGDLVP